MNQPEQTQKRSGKVFWIAIISFLSFCFIIGIIIVLILFKSIFSGMNKNEFEYEVIKSGNEKIAIIDLDYTIITPEILVRQIKKYREDKSIKAIVLRIDSPGGGSAATHEMYEEVKKTRDSGKPVVVSVGTIAASGGYYVACGANKIVANPSSLVGSIGVIIQYITIRDLADKLGIKDVTVTSGDLKDTGNPFRDVSEKDKKYLQDIINDSYELFVEIVAKERKINIDTLKAIATGRVYTGRQAIKLGLIDTLGTLDDAIKIAAELSNIKGEPTIIKEKRKTYFLDLLLDSISKIGLGEINKLLKDEYLNKPVLQYKYEIIK